MGLSRNKVAVSEGAAGSPPCYGDSGRSDTAGFRKRKKETTKRKICLEVVVRFSETKKEKRTPEKNGGVAQLGEHLPCKQGVKGSNPFISTTVRTERTDRKGRCETEWAHSSEG